MTATRATRGRLRVSRAWPPVRSSYAATATRASAPGMSPAAWRSPARCAARAARSSSPAATRGWPPRCSSTRRAGRPARTARPGSPPAPRRRRRLLRAGGAGARRRGRRPPARGLSDDGAPTPGMTLDYHAGAVGDGDGLAGPDFAPLDPAPRRRAPAARRGRGPRPRGARRRRLRRGDHGGGGQRSLARHGGRRSCWPATPRRHRPRAAPPRPLAGLWDELARADLVVCGAGVSAYEAACAGVPGRPRRAGRQPAARDAALSAAGVASALDARGGLDAAELERALRAAPRPSHGAGARRRRRRIPGRRRAARAAHRPRPCCATAPPRRPTARCC